VLDIRLATEADRDAIWDIFHGIVSPGDTYAFDPRISREDALAYWFREDTHTYVAAQDRPASRPEGSRLHQSTGSPSSFHVDIRPIAPLVIEGAARRSRVRRHVVGTYILRANQPGSGSHVANAAFMVAPRVRGLGVGRKMGEHCLNEARRLGFRAMQFNFVVSTNEGAIRLWKQLGFKTVGTLPGAFRHPQKGYVDVYVMFRSLEEISKG
jgi:ribosomal protein S18 acetylase RimI-like enzyme